MEVYKVCVVDPWTKDTVSAIVPTQVALKYEIGDVTYPYKGSPLMAFDSLYRACEFAQERVRWYGRVPVTYICEAEVSDWPMYIGSSADIRDAERIVEFWRYIATVKRGDFVPPLGTVLCDWIRPIERLV